MLRLSYALDASGMVGIFDWHITTDTFYSDERFAAMLSVDPQKGSAGASLSDYLAGIHPEDRARFAAAIERPSRPARSTSRNTGCCKETARCAGSKLAANASTTSKANEARSG